jgi:acetyl-CoA decarbonylase/synthase complex subunit delta
MMAALTQDDEKLMIPMMNNVGNEVWKSKEAKQTIEEAPIQGDPEKRAIIMESVAAVAYLMAGSDVVILRHPESVRMTRSYIELMSNGGSAGDVAGITKKLEAAEVDLVALSPEPNLDFPEPVAAPKPKAAPKAASKAAPAAPKEAPKAAPAAPKEAPKAAPAAAPATAAVPAAGAVAIDMEALKKEIRIAIKEELKAANAEAKPKAKAEEKPVVDLEAEAREKAEAEDAAKREAEEIELRLKRAEEREKHAAERKVKKIRKTAAKVQKNEQEKIMETLNWLHKRTPLI